MIIFFVTDTLQFVGLRGNLKQTLVRSKMKESNLHGRMADVEETVQLPLDDRSYPRVFPRRTSVSRF